MEPQLIFMLTLSLVLIIIAYFIPKKIKGYEIYTTSIFAVMFGLIVDTILAIKYKLYILDKAGVQIPPLIGQVLFYSTTSIIILNSFPYHRSIKYKFFYILCATIITMVIEAIAYRCGFIKYYEWKMWHSALCYPFLISILIIHFRFFQWLVKRRLQRK